MFPSPCGDYGSYRHLVAEREVHMLIQVSVPLRGLWFLSRVINCRNKGLKSRFRPLAGIMVLIAGYRPTDETSQH